MAYIWRRPWTTRPNKQNRVYLQGGPPPAISPIVSFDWTTTSSLPPELTLTRSSTRWYFNSSGVITSAASNAARFNYKPSGASWVPAGFVLEQQDTNFIFQAFVPNNAAWTTGSATVTTGIADLQGGTNAILVTSTASTAGHGIFVGGASLTTGVVYTLRVYVAQGTAPYIWFQDWNNSTDFFNGSLKWSDMSVATNASSVGATMAGPYLVGTFGGRVVYAVDLTYTHEGTSAAQLGVGPANQAASVFGPLSNYSDTAAGTETCYVYGCLYYGGPSRQTITPILTTTAAVTGSADILSSTNSGLLNAKAWAVEVGEMSAATAATLLGVNTAIGLGESAANALTTADGGAQTTANTGTWTSQNRGAIAWDSTPRVSISLDGGAVVTAANTAITPTNLYFGNTNNGASGFLNGHLRMMACYSSLTDSALATVSVVGSSFFGGGFTYTLSGTAGVYTITGSALATLTTRKLPAATGAYVLTGSAATLIRKYVLAEVTGTYALSGSAATVFATRKLAATSGVYTLTGHTAATFATRKLAAATGAYNLTGSAATVFATRRLAEASGAYALTGSAATTSATRKLSVASGAYALTGTSATLIRKYVLSEVSGAYALTGQTASVRVQLSMSGASGSYFLTGSSAPLKRTIKLPLTSGTYNLTGSVAATFATRKLSAVTGSYTLSGHTAATFITRKLSEASGSYTLTGSVATTFATRKLAAASGIYAVTGSAAATFATRNLSAATGSYLINGSAASLVLTAQGTTFTLAGDTGQYNINGSSSTLTATFFGGGGIYTVSGPQVVDHLPLQDGVEVVRAVSFPGSTTQRQTTD